MMGSVGWGGVIAVIAEIHVTHGKPGQAPGQAPGQVAKDCKLKTGTVETQWRSGSEAPVPSLIP